LRTSVAILRIGVALFERAGRRVRITKAGVQLLERAAVVGGAAERLRELAVAIRSGTEGVVSIATPAPPIELVLANAIGEFSRTHPRVQIEIRDTQAPIEALISGDVDLAVAPRQPTCDGFRLFRAHVVVVVRHDHRLARHKRVDVGQLREEPLLTSLPGSLSRGLLDRACRGAGFEPTIRLASASPGVLVELARHGFGVAALASDAIRGTRAKTSSVLTHDDRALSTEAWLHWRRNAELSPSVRGFVELVRRQRN
jgi:DNA-binding transcriptional LysR family regulator